MKKYKKRADLSSNVLFTAKILCTVVLGCLFGYIAFVIIFKGWNTLVEWFQGKWFAFALMLALVIVTAGLWLLDAYKRMKGFKDDGK